MYYYLQISHSLSIAIVTSNAVFFHYYTLLTIMNKKKIAEYAQYGQTIEYISFVYAW